MAVTYVAIANTTLTSQQAEIQFSSIPSTFTDLRLVLAVQGTAANAFWIRWNNLQSGEYTQQWMRAEGTTAGASRTTGANQLNPNAPITAITSGSRNAQGILDIFNYTDSTRPKSALMYFYSAGTGLMRGVGAASNSAAVTSIQIRMSSGLFLADSTAALYGILRA